MASSQVSAVLLPKGSFHKMPWKNGQGLTSEIAIYPEDAKVSENSFLWRLSSAELAQGGSFSSFPGYERYFTLVKGGGLQLEFESNKRQVLLEQGQVCQFSGKEVVSSLLSGGAVQDLNLIYSSSRVKAVFESIALNAKPRSFGMIGTVGFLYCVDGAVSAQVFPGEMKFRIPEGDVLRLDLARAPSTGQEGLIWVEPAVLGATCHVILIELTVQF